jgi:hypothetical protein
MKKLPFFKVGFRLTREFEHLSHDDTKLLAAAGQPAS